MKKLIALLLTLTMVLALGAMGASAETPYPLTLTTAYWPTWGALGQLPLPMPRATSPRKASP